VTLLSSLVAVAVTLALLWPLRKIAMRFGILDDPGPRKVHTDPVPYLGGLAILGGVSAAVLWLRPEWWSVAVMLASVLIPWGIWRMTAGLAEFSLGWLTGGLMRALVSSAMVGIATPLFDLLNQPMPSTGYFSVPQTLLLLCCSLIYLILCWTIPSLASRLAGQASLGLTGSTLTSGAMGLARFGFMASGLSSTVSRVISPMLQRK